jgi:hypothetical protein
VYQHDDGQVRFLTTLHQEPAENTAKPVVTCVANTPKNRGYRDSSLQPAFAATAPRQLNHRYQKTSARKADQQSMGHHSMPRHGSQFTEYLPSRFSDAFPSVPIIDVQTICHKQNQKNRIANLDRITLFLYGKIIAKESLTRGSRNR